ncbi:effector-associated constant component EACC1 [Streptosporangium sp. LJ11]|uniref:effector-associated constant component EACC1 n=1 Tax=Streptosporangium sp. LJ11 TaxID=3436927 RepID=UPI003F7A1ABF
MTANTIQIGISGKEAEKELQSFYNWLRNDEDIRQHARVSLRWSPPQESEMGTALEAIELVLSNSFEVANLTLAYLAWRHTRREKSKVTFKRGDFEITIEGDDEEKMKKIIQSFKKDPE